MQCWVASYLLEWFIMAAYYLDLTARHVLLLLFKLLEGHKTAVIRNMDQACMAKVSKATYSV